MKKKLQVEVKTLKVPLATHASVVAHCKSKGLKIYLWVSKSLAEAIKQDQ